MKRNDDDEAKPTKSQRKGVKKEPSTISQILCLRKCEASKTTDKQKLLLLILFDIVFGCAHAMAFQTAQCKTIVDTVEKYIYLFVNERCFVSLRNTK